MYCALPGSPAAKVRDFLKPMAALDKIQIGLSYHVVFELLQKAAPQYRDDRLGSLPYGAAGEGSKPQSLSSVSRAGVVVFIRLLAGVILHLTYAPKKAKRINASIAVRKS
jgi:hypothetical protein